MFKCWLSRPTTLAKILLVGSQSATENWTLFKIEHYSFDNRPKIMHCQTGSYDYHSDSHILLDSLSSTLQAARLSFSTHSLFGHVGCNIDNLLIVNIVLYSLVKLTDYSTVLNLLGSRPRCQWLEAFTTDAKIIRLISRRIVFFSDSGGTAVFRRRLQRSWFEKFSLVILADFGPYWLVGKEWCLPLKGTYLYVSRLFCYFVNCLFHNCCIL